MNQYTDTQLKQALAKMLPDSLCAGSPQGAAGLFRRPRLAIGTYREVLDTELLHLCWMVEEAIPSDTLGSFYESQMESAITHSMRAHLTREERVGLTLKLTWQQRVVALAKVKGQP